MVTKLIHNVDEKAWRKFAGYCKAKGVKIGDELSDLLEAHVNGAKRR